MALILVVDDEPDIRFLAQVALESDGHLVMTASDGDDALAAVEVEVPDVVLLDVLMSRIDGWEVLDRLKSHLDERISQVRVIMMTSMGGAEDQARGGVNGAIQYLVKPVDTDELLEAVRAAVAGEPEREQRLRAQTDALTSLARMQKGLDPDHESGAPQPRLSELERIKSSEPREEPRPVVHAGADLTETQRRVLKTVAQEESVMKAAAVLDVSRANVYASLRRSARTLEIADVPEVLARLRSGHLVIDDV